MKPRAVEAVDPPDRASLLHLATASAFALAQPLYDVLGRGPEFFVAHRCGPAELLAFVAVLSLAVPGGLVLLERLAALAGSRVARAVHRTLFALLVFAAAVPPLGRAPFLSAGAALLLAGLAGVVVAFAYGRLETFRSFLTFASPVLLVFPALFLLRPGIRHLVFPSQKPVVQTSVRNPAPVVLVVLDQLTLPSLMNDAMAIDAVRFPGFGELARSATWLRNTATVSSSTRWAVPAILTARRPSAESTDDRENVFTLLAGSHRLQVIESITRLCPSDLNTRAQAPIPALERIGSLRADLGILAGHVFLPAGLARRLPRVDATWRSFAAGPSERNDDLSEFVRSVNATPMAGTPPTLSFLHTVRPHWPWRHLPSGRQILCREGVAPHGASGPGLTWSSDPWEAVQARQRYLLEVGYVDAFLSRLWDSLKATGRFDPSLIVLVADHGITFRSGHPAVEPDPETVDDIAFVPFFVKLPFQRDARVIDTPVRTVDVLPTIAATLGVRIPWRVDGVSVFDPAPAKVTPRTICVGGCAREIPIGRDPAQAFAFQHRQFESLGTGAWDSVFRAGPCPDLLGSPAPAPGAEPTGPRFEIDESSVSRIHIEGATVRQVVDPAEQVLPLQPKGVVGVAPERMPLAIALNGRIVATTQTYVEAGESRFSALLPEGAYRSGPNTLEVFRISGSPGARSLEALRGGEDERWELASPSDDAAPLLRSGSLMRKGEGTLVGCLEEERISPEGLVVRGWAVDVARERLVDRIVVFVNEKPVLGGRTRAVRVGIARRFHTEALEPCGFSFSVSLPAGVSPTSARIRVFAVSFAGEALELPLGPIAGGFGREAHAAAPFSGSIAPGVAEGVVEIAMVRGGRLVVTGWAGSAVSGPAARVLVTVRRGTFEVFPELERTALAEAQGEKLRRSGFRLDLPVGARGDVSELDQLRVVALGRDGHAAELPTGHATGRTIARATPVPRLPGGP